MWKSNLRNTIQCDALLLQILERVSVGIRTTGLEYRIERRSYVMYILIECLSHHRETLTRRARTGNMSHIVLETCELLRWLLTDIDCTKISSLICIMPSWTVSIMSYTMTNIAVMWVSFWYGNGRHKMTLYYQKIIFRLFKHIFKILFLPIKLLN